MKTTKSLLFILAIAISNFSFGQSSAASKYSKSVDMKWINPDKVYKVRDICFSPAHPNRTDVYFAVAHKNGTLSIFSNYSFQKKTEVYGLYQHISFDMYGPNLSITPDEAKLNNSQGTLQFSSDGKYLFSGGWIFYSKIKNKYCSQIYIFDMDKLDVNNSTAFDRTPREYSIITVDGAVYKFDISSDDKKILVNHNDNNMNLISVFDIESRKREWSNVLKQEVVDAVFGKDPTTIFYTQGKDIIQYSTTENKVINTISLKKTDVCRLYNWGQSLVYSDFLNKLYCWDSQKNKTIEIKTKEYISEIQNLRGENLLSLSGIFVGGGKGNIYEVEFYDKKIYPVKWTYQCEDCPFIRKISLSGNGEMFANFNNENSISIHAR